MASNWMPGAIVVPSSHDGGSMLGGEKKVTWHTFECGYSVTAKRGAYSLIKAGNEVHLCFNPITGQTAQMLPANRAGRGLRNSSGGAQTNRSGSINIQIEVIGRAANPWTKDLTPEGKAGLGLIMQWLRSLDIPDTWPAGNPPNYPYGRNSRSTSSWSKSGHFCHSQVPENTHGDCGAIDLAVLFAQGSSRPPIKPAPVKPQAARNALSHMQEAVRVATTGVWDVNTERGMVAVRDAAFLRVYPQTIPYVQNRIGTKADGAWGPKSRAALVATVKILQTYMGVKSDGVWGPATDARFNQIRKSLADPKILKR